MNIFGMVKERMAQKRADNRKEKAIYDSELMRQKEIYAKERAKIKVHGIREKARVRARDGRVRPMVKKISQGIKAHQQRMGTKHSGHQFGLSGGSSSGPQFGLEKPNNYREKQYVAVGPYGKEDIVTRRIKKKKGGPKFGL